MIWYLLVNKKMTFSLMEISLHTCTYKDVLLSSSLYLSYRIRRLDYISHCLERITGNLR